MPQNHYKKASSTDTKQILYKQYRNDTEEVIHSQDLLQAQPFFYAALIT